MKLGFRLLCVTDRYATGGRDLIEVVNVLVRAGLGSVQIREKDLPDDEFRTLAQSLIGMDHFRPVEWFFNSRVSLAREFGAGLHLPEASDVRAAREVLGGSVSIGVSAHSIHAALGAERDGATFIVYGPVYSPISKSSGGSPCGVETLSRVARAVGIPVVAIGGITPANARACLTAGAQAVAAVGSLLGAGDVRKALMEYLPALGRL